jgi:hypothetical protein
MEQTAEQAIEQVAQGSGVPVARGSALVVLFLDQWRAQCAEDPDVAGRCKPLVLDLAMAHDMAFTARDGDRRGAGVRLDSPGVAEAGAVVAELGQYPGTVQWAEPGKLAMISASGC